MTQEFWPTSKPTLLDSLIDELATQLAPETETELERAFAERIQRAYGTLEAYNATKQRLGMSDEHAAYFERYGVVLQPKQMAFAVWALGCDDPDGPEEVGIGGAKGPGKSFALFAVAALFDCQRWPGLKVLYLRKTGKAAKEQLEDLALAVLQFMPEADIQRERILFPNGSRIIIGGFKDDAEALKYAGIENDVLIVEETTQLKGKTYITLRLTNRSSKTRAGVAWRPRTYNSTNPLGVGHSAYKKRFVDNEHKCLRREAYSKRRKFIFATVDDNVFVNPEYVTNLDELVGAEYRAYRKGDWDVSAGAYFEAWDERIHVIPPITDLSWVEEAWCSMDFGYNHPNVVHLHVRDGDGVIYTIDELVHRKRHPEEIAPDVHAWLRQYGLTRKDLKYFLVGSDAFSQTGRGKTTVAQQYAAAGLMMSRADTSPGSRVAGALAIAQLLGSPERGIPPKWYCTSKCTRLRETLPYLERDPNQVEDVLKVNADERGEGGDDSYDTLRYGVHKPHATTIS